MGIFDKWVVKWILDNDLNIINMEIFGLGFMLKDDEDFVFRSSVFVINENGVIVGILDVCYKDWDICIIMLVIFENGEVKEFFD